MNRKIGRCSLIDLTSYTELWINLATAGRGIKQPFPKWISQQGWALIQDKHHQNESTDRYVPLTPALIKQIQSLRGLMGMLGEQIELRVDLSSYAVQLYDPHQIEDLVRNWARKLVRSDRNQLPGGSRTLDLGTGYGVVIHGIYYPYFLYQPLNNSGLMYKKTCKNN